MDNRQQIPPGRSSQRQRIPCGGRTSAFPSACGPLRHPILRKASPARSSHRQEATEPAVRSSSARFSNEPKHSSEVRSTTGHPLRNRASKAFFAIPPNRSERTDRSSLPKKQGAGDGKSDLRKQSPKKSRQRSSRTALSERHPVMRHDRSPPLRRNTDKTRSICNPPPFSGGTPSPSPAATGGVTKSRRWVPPARTRASANPSPGDGTPRFEPRCNRADLRRYGSRRKASS